MKRYGIWGLGVVGKSVIRFLHTQGHSLAVYDTRSLTPDEESFLIGYNVRHYPADQQEKFFQDCDYIVPSPGIPLTPAQRYLHKMVHELSLFTPLWRKPLIAITGSLGKTTLVTLLQVLLTDNGYPAITGGNIGTAMLDLIALQENYAFGILELSSFQLEYAQTFAPDLAIITNLYANHLDRHRTMEEYFGAKAHIFSHQRAEQKRLLPIRLIREVQKYTDLPCTYFATKEPSAEELALLRSNDVLYTLDENRLVRKCKIEAGLTTTSVSISAAHQERGAQLLLETWLILLVVADMLGLLSSYKFMVPDFKPLEHRIEYVGSYKGIAFYNDSKSTIVEATKAAVVTLSARPIHLILGGVSKGVDRGALLGGLKPYVASVSCFGKEADQLASSCKASGMVTSVHATLKDALSYCVSRAHKDEIVLFSPAGASYDLYKDYQERGKHFKKLVEELSS